MKKIVLLGASGSIGLQTLDIVKRNRDRFEVVGLSVGYNIEVLRDILKDFKPRLISVIKKENMEILKKEYPDIDFCYSDEGLNKLAQYEDYDLLVNALVGFSGLRPTLLAIENKKDIALANKESLVVAGKIIMDSIKKYGVKIYPIDSEHSAILQCLQNSNMDRVKKVIITASGGAFRDLSRKELENVSLSDALKHPNWSMGAKITIDSATMMNKGFEVIEAAWLYGLPYEMIEVVIHKESIVHSMVEYVDGAIMAQLGSADMRIPIQYSLTYPDRLKLESDFSISEVKNLTFAKMDFERFPLMKLAYYVGKKQGNLPTVMNAVNEVANEAFRDGKISFLKLEECVINVTMNFEFKEVSSLDEIIYYNDLAKEEAKKYLGV